MAYDRTTRIFRAWLNGQEAAALDAPVDGPAIGSAWTKFELRNEIYHGGSGTVLFDDVALGTARIGCPAM
jgi:hypothetical protein